MEYLVIFLKAGVFSGKGLPGRIRIRVSTGILNRSVLVGAGLLVVVLPGVIPTLPEVPPLCSTALLTALTSAHHAAASQDLPPTIAPWKPTLRWSEEETLILGGFGPLNPWRLMWAAASF